MFSDKLLETLDRTENKEKVDEETTKLIDKLRKQERLSSEEFQKVFDALWKEGPKIKY